MGPITPFLTFDGKADEATKFYTSIFPSAKVIETYRYGDAGPGPKGEVMMTCFELLGQRFFALNGPSSQPSFAMSLFVECETQAEVDTLWDKLTADGGKPIQCGWLTDKYGITWQIVPKILPALIQDKDPAKATRVMKAMMGMVKLDIAELQRAYNG
jgi:predicted 3-demethylubiquinone-9 3-methyltransferase (glyoxalase superfamily)